MYEIVKDIPIPVMREKYPLKEMEVGDSFFVELDEQSLYTKRASLSSCCSQLKPKKFTVRKVDNGIRVWRVE